MQNDVRAQALSDWLKSTQAHPVQRIEPLYGDASFRRYFRVHCHDRSYIVMDAPPEKECCHAYVAIARGLRKLGLNTPEVFAEDQQQGFLLLTDFGDRLLLDALNEATADALYQKALDQLLVLQTCSGIAGYEVKPYAQGLYSYYEEMSWFDQWFLQRHMGWQLTAAEQKGLDHILKQVSAQAEQQPQVFVHRDYHSRNLMLIDDDSPLGILDFQDAVWGPVTYDIMSLLRDCYVDWPIERVHQWVRDYQQQAITAGTIKETSSEQFIRWFDWVGLQRNLKCIGLFIRLKLRDHKPGYMKDIPRILGYAKYVVAQYPELSLLHDIFMRIDAQGTGL
ncbi:MAG: phosphotransferase [Gammaproteobacteria bacterium]|nr:phosphotransferase [Gammaproteobacteria bacterium]MCH9743828.1 phosphotransferase [Gammaproteobacteria bacterium]